MKKYFFHFLSVVMMALFAILPLSADVDELDVSIPAFQITINGTSISNEYNQYPFLLYKGITYFPMTYDGARFLGLKANWYPKTKYYGEKGVLFVGVCPESEKQSEFKQTKSLIKNRSRYRASVADYGLALNTTTYSQFVQNRKEEYPVLNFRGVSYFPLTWKFAVEEFDWEYPYSYENGLVINSKKAFRPIIDDKIIGYTLPFENTRRYFYDRDYYVVYPQNTYAPVYNLVIRKRDEAEREYDLESQLKNTKYEIITFNVEKNENSSFVESKPKIVEGVFYMNCEARKKGESNSQRVAIQIGVDLENGKIISEKEIQSFRFFTK